MTDILFLAHRIPYPPDKGDKIRSWHLLKYLAQRATVHLGAFVDDPADMAHVEMLRAVCGEVMLRPLRPADRWKRALRGLWKRDPLSLALYYDRQMVEWVHRTVRRNRVRGIFAFSSQMAPYAMPHIAGRRSVMDFVDVDSEKWRQYAGESRNFRQILYSREAELLRTFEKYAARQFGASLLVSEQEAKVFRRIVGSSANTIQALSNGVDFNYFSPDAGFEPLPKTSSLTLVFTGAMDYRPNAEAVIWFADQVWPRIRAERPDALFQIVGSKPTPDVLNLETRDGVVVTGRVDDVRPYIAGADVVVAPLRIARGIQNKVLEAMAMAKPVVATRAAFEGIDATPGEHLIVEDDPKSMAKTILEVAGNEAFARALGREARQRVVARYDWESNLTMLDGLLGLETPPIGQAIAAQ